MHDVRLMQVLSYLSRYIIFIRTFQYLCLLLQVSLFFVSKPEIEHEQEVAFYTIEQKTTAKFPLVPPYALVPCTCIYIWLRHCVVMYIALTSHSSQYHYSNFYHAITLGIAPFPKVRYAQRIFDMIMMKEADADSECCG